MNINARAYGTFTCIKDKNGKAILYNYNAQPGTKGFDYKLNFKKQGKK